MLSNRERFLDALKGVEAARRALDGKTTEAAAGGKLLGGVLETPEWKAYMAACDTLDNMTLELGGLAAVLALVRPRLVMTQKVICDQCLQPWAGWGSVSTEAVPGGELHTRINATDFHNRCQHCVGIRSARVVTTVYGGVYA